MYGQHITRSHPVKKGTQKKGTDLFPENKSVPLFAFVCPHSLQEFVAGGALRKQVIP
jgi:hypothetical protein